MSQTLKIESGDVVIAGSTGRPVMTIDANKIRQDLTEFFTVEVLPNGFGAGLEQLIGVVEISPDVFVSLANRQIRDGFDTLKSLQSLDRRISRPPGERLLALSYLTVEKDPSNPTQYWVRANFVTEQGMQLALSVPKSSV
jgi:hypothetical protein